MLTLAFSQLYGNLYVALSFSPIRLDWRPSAVRFSPQPDAGGLPSRCCPTVTGAAVPPQSAIRRARRRRWQQKGRLGRPLAWRGRGRWGCGATGSPSTRGPLFLRFRSVSCLGAAGLGASRGAQARARGQEAGSSRPCTWHLRWGGHSHGTPAACALAQPQRAPLLCPLPSAKAGGPSILHLLLEWASTIEQRSNIKTWFRASKRDICAGQKKSTGRLSSAEFAHVVYVIHMCESRGAESVR